MSFLLFLRGLVGVLLVFAAATYLMTHSLATTLVRTVVCGLLIQVGYFAVVLFLVWRSTDRGEAKGAAEKGEAAPKLAKGEVPSGTARRLSDASRTRHP